MGLRSLDLLDVGKAAGDCKLGSIGFEVQLVNLYVLEALQNVS